MKMCRLFYFLHGFYMIICRLIFFLHGFYMIICRLFFFLHRIGIRDHIVCDPTFLYWRIQIGFLSFILLDQSLPKVLDKIQDINLLLLAK